MPAKKKKKQIHRNSLGLETDLDKEQAKDRTHRTSSLVPETVVISKPAYDVAALLARMEALEAKKSEPAADPALLACLLSAKGALIEAGTPEAFSAVSRIRLLEQDIPAKVAATASVIQKGKALAERKGSGIEVHPDEINEFLNLFHAL